MHDTALTASYRTGAAIGVGPVNAACLLLAYAFPPSSESGAQRPYRLFKYLPQNGCDVMVVCCASGVPDGSKERNISRVAGESASAGARRLSRVIQRVLPYNEQLDWLPAAVRKAGQLIRARKIRVIVSTSPPNCTHLAALILKHRFGIKWVADFRDPIYGNPFRNRRWGYPYDACLERLIFHEADAVIAVTDAMADAWKSRYPQHASKIHLIWNGYDPEVSIEPSPIPARSHKVLLHAGSIYGARHPSMLFSAIERLVAQRRLDPALVRVRLIGDIDPNWLQAARHQFVELHATGCIEYVDRRVSQHEAVRQMSEADGLLLLDLNAMDATLQVPAKLFDYVRIGRPILAFTAHGSPTERILLGSNVPDICIYPGTPEQEVDEKVAAFFALPTNSVAPSCWFREQFDGAVQTTALSSILESLAS